jgi:Na+/proline symporter
MLLVALVVGIAVLVGAAYAAYRMQSFGLPPSHNARFLLALGGEAAIMLPAVWGLLWWRRRERARLGD